MIMTFDERVKFYMGEELLKFEKIEETVINKYFRIVG